MDSLNFWKKVGEGVAQAGFGISFQTWKNIGDAVVDLCSPSTYDSETLGADLLLDVMLFMNMSKTDRTGWANRLYAKYGPVEMSKAIEKVKGWEQKNRHTTEMAKSYVQNIDPDFEKEMSRLMEIEKKYKSPDITDEEAEEILKQNPMLKSEDGICDDFMVLFDEIKGNIKEGNDTDDGAMKDADIRKELDNLIKKWKAANK